MRPVHPVTFLRIPGNHSRNERSLMAPMTRVTVTVPEDKLFLLRRYAAQLCAGGGHDAVRGQGETEALTLGDPGAVHRAYLGGNSENWRPFLDHLADSPGVWVDWPELCDIIEVREGKIQSLRMYADWPALVTKLGR